MALLNEILEDLKWIFAAYVDFCSWCSFFSHQFCNFEVRADCSGSFHVWGCSTVLLEDLSSRVLLPSLRFTCIIKLGLAFRLVSWLGGYY